MINRLRFKFIVISMLSLVLLVFATNISTNIVMRKANENQVDNMLRQSINVRTSQSIQPSGNLAIPRPSESLEVIIVEISESNEISILGESSYLSQEQIREISKSILEMDEESSNFKGYRFVKKDDVLAFVDRSIQDAMLTDLRRITYFVSAASILILSIITFLLSKMITEPIKIAFEKQKRFITDSSHELKTPLAILSANTDMLQMEHEENKYLTEIKKQSYRMNELVNGLLTLSQTDENLSNEKFERFNLSECISSNVFSFEALAYEKKRGINPHIEDEVYISGSEKSITELFEALMDNAIKYSLKDSTIDVSLFLMNGHKILEVKNKCVKVSDEDKEKLFDTFYRIGYSRNSETGGHGLGLSIAKSIVHMHSGKIEVDNGENEITFRVIF